MKETAKKIYDSVLARLAIEVPLFAESVLNKALKNVGTNPNDVTAFEMKIAIEKHIEPFLRKNLEINKGLHEVGAGIIIYNDTGKIQYYSPVIKKLIPDIDNHGFLINKQITTDIIQFEGKSIKILKIPIKNKEGKIDYTIFFVNDITLDLKLDEEIYSVYKKIKKQNEELIKIRNELQESDKELDEKYKLLEKSELATLNIMEDLQDTINDLEIAKKEIDDLNTNLEQKVGERTKEVQELLNQKDEFIQQLGHDLKTPLTPLNTLLPIIAKKTKNKELKKMIDITISNTKQITKLVKNTLELAKLKTTKNDFELKETNLLNEINKVIDSNKLIIDKRNITIENRLDNNLLVIADSFQIESLFENLLTNAIKYMKEEGGTIKIDSRKENGFVEVMIKDDGIGLTEDNIKKIFNEFYKADWSRHDMESTGLGLSICKKIVERHGGNIWVESEGLGKGSTFHFTLKTDNRKNN